MLQNAAFDTNTGTESDVFISDSHLPQLLPTTAYCSDEFQAREVEQLFKPAWHLLGTRQELPGDGDFITADILGTPVIAWNRGGEIKAFLNICPHRFAKLCRQTCGHAGDRLVCQYHGWEFADDGNTKRIPDARSFRPLKQGELGLRPLLCETVGGYVFVNLNETAQPLREWLGPISDVLEERTGEDASFCFTRDWEIEANWKVTVENSLESYHVTMVHADTFGHSPEADVCFHEFGDAWHWFETITPYEPASLKSRIRRRIKAFIGQGEVGRYRQWLRHPNLEIVEAGPVTIVTSVMPISPGRCSRRLRMFCNTGSRNSIARRMTGKLTDRFYSRLIDRVQDEDGAVLPSVQRGLASPLQPLGAGLISIREERLFYFQQAILNAVEPEAESPVGSSSAAESKLPAKAA